MDHPKGPAEQQFVEITLPHLEQLYRLAYVRVGNAEDAEDILQETYLKAFRSFGSLRDERTAKGWLTQILINVVRDHFRKSSRSVTTTDIDELHVDLMPQAAEPGPEARMCEDEMEPQLIQALNSMPETLLMPLLLREIDGASYAEIGVILDIPKGTVMSRLFRARTLLRRHLHPYGERTDDVEKDKDRRSWG